MSGSRRSLICIVFVISYVILESIAESWFVFVLSSYLLV